MSGLLSLFFLGIVGWQLLPVEAEAAALLVDGLFKPGSLKMKGHSRKEGAACNLQPLC